MNDVPGKSPRPPSAAKGQPSGPGQGSRQAYSPDQPTTPTAGAKAGARPAPRDTRAKRGQAARALPKDQRRIARPANTGDVARDAVALHLAMQADVYPRLSIDPPVLPPSLDPRDAALAHAINAAVSRRWVTLERLIAKGCRQPLSKVEAHALGAMLCGAAQIVLLDRVPAHAAVNHAVEWTKQSLGPPAAGLVNAVLHRIVESVGARGEGLPADWATSRRHIPLGAGRFVELTGELLPDDPAHALACATGLPRALLASFAGAFGPEAAQRLALASVEDAPTIINAAHDAQAREALSVLTRDAGLLLEPHQRAGHFVYAGPRDGLVTLLERFGTQRGTPAVALGGGGPASATTGARPGVWVQDPASSNSLLTLLSSPGSSALIERVRAMGERARVLDLCAGQGTKTRQLAAIFPQATILATDIDAKRRRVLGEVFGTSGRVRLVPYVELAGPKAPVSAGPAPKHEGFDLILLDVPCSNTGVLARRAEAKYRFGDHSVGQLVQVQRDALALAGRLLRGLGALVVYATCSLDERENAQQARWAAGKLGLDLVMDELTMPSAGPPATAWNDGAYVALLRASGQGPTLAPNVNARDLPDTPTT